MERTQFTFYESFAKALRRIRKKTDRADAYDAIVDYALYGIEPDTESMPDAVAIAFELIRPNLNSARRMSEGGRKVSSRLGQGIDKEKEGEGEGEKEVKKEIEVEVEVEVEKENKKESAAAAKVMRLYTDAIQTIPSAMATEGLKSYTEELGADVVCYAIDTALDNNVRSWRYIEAILKRYREEGLTSVSAIKQREQARADGKARQKADNSAQSAAKVTAEEINANRKALELLKGAG